MVEYRDTRIIFINNLYRYFIRFMTIYYYNDGWMIAFFGVVAISIFLGIFLLKCKWTKGILANFDVKTVPNIKAAGRSGSEKEGLSSVNNTIFVKEERSYESYLHWRRFILLQVSVVLYIGILIIYPLAIFYSVLDVNEVAWLLVYVFFLSVGYVYVWKKFFRRL